MRSAITNILGSSALSQLLVLVSLPFLTRQYQVADFGAFGVGTTLALLASTALTLRLENSLHKSPKQADCVAALIDRCILWGGACLVPVIALGVWISGSQWLNGVSVFFFAMGHAIFISRSVWLNLHQSFIKIACMQLAVPIVFITAALLAGSYNSTSFNGLLAAQGLSYALAGCLGILLTQKFANWNNTQCAKPLAILKQEVQSLRYLVPSQLLSITSQNALVVGAVVVFGEQAGGLLLIAQRMSRAPVMVIGNGLNEVLRSRFVERNRIVHGFKVVSTFSVSAGFLMIIAIWLLPENLLLLLLGDNWIGIQSVVRITIIVAAFQLIATSVMSILSTFEKRTDLLVNVLLSSGSFLILGICWKLDSSLVNYLWASSSWLISVYFWGYLKSRQTATRVSRVCDD